MSKRGITVILAVLCLAGIGGSVFVYLGRDRKGPVIQVPAEQISYREGAAEEELLKGVTAMDDRDGDVSDSLMVEKILPSDDGSTAQVIYAAMDKSNNVTKAYRSITYDRDVVQGNGAASGEKEGEPAASPEPSKEPEKEPTVTEEPEASPTPTEAPEVSPTPETDPDAYNPEHTAGVLEAPAGTELLLIEPCRVREAPTTESEVIASLEKGAVVEKQGTSGEWVKVTVDGAFGYIRSDLVSLNG